MLHNYKKCAVCGKMFIQVRQSDVCPDCLHSEMELFKRVREFLDKNPGSGVVEISKVTEIPENIIVKWVDEGRLEKTKMKPIKRCSLCNDIINTGTICDKCAKELKKDLEKKEEKSQKHMSMFITKRK